MSLDANDTTLKLGDTSYVIVLVDTKPKYTSMLLSLNLETEHFAVDLEGDNLSATGKAAFIQVRCKGSSVIYIIDCLELEKEIASNEPGGLKSILQGPVTKLFFDVRNDSAALHAQYGIDLNNTLDLQVAEVLHRKASGLRARFVSGLKKLLQEGPFFSSAMERRDAVDIKQEGFKLMDRASATASTPIFLERPVSKAILMYSAVDIVYFDKMKEKLYDGLAPGTKVKALNVSKDRVGAWRNPRWDPKSRDNAIVNF
ncbi:hypothetical protein HDV05_002539 [Chytridiales sp. JEL 0842]|nr:hypothetical protein HDV05_002539 [Chytridiales sp. JEL 0842]